MKIRYFSRRRMATPISAKVFLGRGGGLAVCPQTHSYPQKRPIHSLWNTGAFEVTSLDHSTSTALENFPHLIFPHIICSCDNLKWAFLTTKSGILVLLSPGRDVTHPPCIWNSFIATWVFWRTLWALCFFMIPDLYDYGCWKWTLLSTKN